MKNVFEKLYKNVCDIYENISVKDGYVTKTRLERIYKNVPCKISFYSNSYETKMNRENDINYVVGQRIKIFLSKNVSVRAGCIFEIEQNGKMIKYKNASIPFIYTNHQEVVLMIYDEKA